MKLEWSAESTAADVDAECKKSELDQERDPTPSTPLVERMGRLIRVKAKPICEYKNWCDYAASGPDQPSHKRSTIGVEGEECDETILLIGINTADMVRAKAGIRKTTNANSS